MEMKYDTIQILRFKKEEMNKEVARLKRLGYSVRHTNNMEREKRGVLEYITVMERKRDN